MKLLKILLVFSVLLLTFSAHAQSGKNKKHNSKTTALVFPDDWLGKYKGTMDWYSGGIKRAEIPITIEILKTDNPQELIWRTTYDSTKIFPQKTVKDYLISRNDSLQPGHYIMDEQNGIFIDMKFMDNCFYSCFDVITEGKSGSSRIISVDRLLSKNKLYHEVLSYSEPTKISGNIGDSEGFTVKSSPNIDTQKATLIRVK